MAFPLRLFDAGHMQIARRLMANELAAGLGSGYDRADGTLDRTNGIFIVTPWPRWYDGTPAGSNKSMDATYKLGL